MKNKIRNIITFAFGSFCFAALASCHTVQGVGQDVETVGDEIQAHATH